MPRGEYTIKQGFSESGLSQLSIHKNRKGKAELDYEYVVGRGAWRIDWIRSDLPGGAQALVYELACLLGSDQQVFGVITESQSYDVLDNLGWVREAIRVKHLIALPNEVDLMQELTMWRVLNGGGLRDIGIYLRYDLVSMQESGCPVIVSFSART